MNVKNKPNCIIAISTTCIDAYFDVSVTSRELDKYQRLVSDVLSRTYQRLVSVSAGKANVSV